MPPPDLTALGGKASEDDEEEEELDDFDESSLPSTSSNFRRWVGRRNKRDSNPCRLT